MQVGNGPAAVIGDERRIMPLSSRTYFFLKENLHDRKVSAGGGEGALIRMIRESEDLPG